MSEDQTTIRVQVISNEGLGGDGVVELPRGTTLGQLFDRTLPGKAAGRYTIRVNYSPDHLPGSHVLQEGDRVSFTVNKQPGA